jgi:hypothetical protein
MQKLRVSSIAMKAALCGRALVRSIVGQALGHSGAHRSSCRYRHCASRFPWQYNRRAHDARIDPLIFIHRLRRFPQIEHLVRSNRS